MSEMRGEMRRADTTSREGYKFEQPERYLVGIDMAADFVGPCEAVKKFNELSAGYTGSIWRTDLVEEILVHQIC